MSEAQSDPLNELMGRLSVLVVEDEGFFLRLAQTVLKQLGVQNIVTARDGIEALQILNSPAAPLIHLIISDWEMPKMSGLGLLKEVRRTRPAMPFLMLTAHATEAFVRTAKDNGVDAYVIKPFSPADLGRRIKGIFQQR